MKAKKTPPRRRISFAVDREEIEINSDWVEAVMASTAPRPPVAPFPAPPPEDGASRPPAPAGVFFASDENSSTDAHSTSGAGCTSVENPSAVAEIAAVDKTASVAESATVEAVESGEKTAPVEKSATDKEGQIENFRGLAVADSATVVNCSTGAELTTGEVSASTKDHRIPRPRPIVRVTDGLTPGQYAVYSLMYEAGESSGESARIYKGGYADLGRLTGLSKRGLQHIVSELQAKQVIRLHQQPGYHRTQTSAYLVPAPQSVLDVWFANGWRHSLGKSKTLVR